MLDKELAVQARDRNIFPLLLVVQAVDHSGTKVLARHRLLPDQRQLHPKLGSLHDGENTLAKEGQFFTRGAGIYKVSGFADIP